MVWIIVFVCAEVLMITWRIKYLRLGPLTVSFWPNGKPK